MAGRGPASPRGFAEQDRRALGVGPAAELGDQPGLADPGLAGDGDHPWVPLANLAPGVLESPQLLLAPDERFRFARQLRGQREPFLFLRLPGELTARHRLRDALQPQLADLPEVEPAPASDKPADEVRGENLAAVGAIAEALRDHDRGTEVVALIADRLADVETDADPHPLRSLAPILAVNGLLDPDRAGSGVEAAREGHHQAVARGSSPPDRRG